MHDEELGVFQRFKGCISVGKQVISTKSVLAKYFVYCILPSYLFGQPCLFGQYGNDVNGEPAPCPNFQ